MTRKHSTAVYDEASAELISSAADVPRAVADAAAYAGVADSEETMVFARQLETIKNRVYETMYAELKGPQFVPISAEGGPDSEFITFRIWDNYTMAKLITNYATDWPLVGSSAREVTMKYYDVGNAYAYSILDLRRAARAGVALSDRDARNARWGIELAKDDAIAFGVSQVGSYGLLNNPNVTTATLPNGSWSSATGEDILEDLNYLVTTMYSDSLELFQGDTLLMSTDAYRLLQTKLLSVANGSNVSVLDIFQKQNPGITVGSWTKLATADAEGDGPRIVFYKKDPMVLEFELGLDFEVFPAQQQGLMLTHLCRARFAGVAIHHPLAVMYADNAAI